MRISSAARLLANGPYKFRSLTTLVATEEFPMSFSVIPKSRSTSVVTEGLSSSGIKLISREVVNPGPVSIKVVIKSGSRAESSSEKGAAHLLSVSAFSGHTKKSGIKLMRNLENIGAVVSATSDREKITYNLSALSENFPEAFQLVAEAISLPIGAPHLVEDRKSVAKVAYDEKDTTAEIVLSELLHESMFGEATPLGSSLFSNCLDSLSFEDVMAYRSRVFVSGNVGVVATGVSQAALKDLVEKHLILPAGSTPSPASPYTGGESRLRADLGTTFAALAYGLSGADSGNVASILAAVLKTRLAAAGVKGYSASAFSAGFSSCSAVGVYVNAPAGQVGANLQLAADELRSIANGSATAQIELAKTQLSLAAALGMEGSAVTDAMVSAVVRGQSLASTVSFNVDAKKVAAAAAEALASVPSYAVVGVTAGVPSFATVSALSKSTGVVPGL